jgi:hypothetical protein
MTFFTSIDALKGSEQIIHLEEVGIYGRSSKGNHVGRLRHNTTKQDMRHAASTLKCLYAEKEVPNERREERKEWKKKIMKNYYDILTKKMFVID